MLSSKVAFAFMSATILRPDGMSRPTVLAFIIQCGHWAICNCATCDWSS